MASSVCPGDSTPGLAANGPSATSDGCKTTFFGRIEARRPEEGRSGGRRDLIRSGPRRVPGGASIGTGLFLPGRQVRVLGAGVGVGRFQVAGQRAGRDARLIQRAIELAPPLARVA